MENISERQNIKRLSEWLSSASDKAHTEVSPYNGSANSTRPLPIARNQSVTSTSDLLGRAESGRSADVYAPEYAPYRTENPLWSRDVPEGRPVVRCPQQLRLHRALEEFGWTGKIKEFNEDARLSHFFVADPILIATSGTILSGFGRWQSAIYKGRLEINCIEYPLNEDETLQFILTHYKTLSGWNDFVRICLALTLEATLQQKALDHMRAGGKLKGLANLPEAHRIDVRKEIARAAGVGDRNVSNVRTILQRAHVILVRALKEGVLSINRAFQLCKLPKAEQLEQFVSYSEERAINQVIRRSIPQPKEKRASLDVLSVLDALQREEVQQPGSVVVRVGRHKRTVVLISADLSARFPSQRELKLP